MKLSKFLNLKVTPSKKRIIKEFRKVDTPLVDYKMYAYRDFVIYDIFKQVSLVDDHLFDNVVNPITFIEETLFSYLNSN
jgi:hypothetical protein